MPHNLSMKHYPVIIVGAGPAGSTCAYHLAKHNVETLLIDKAKMPRLKPCGGGFPQKTRNLYDFDISEALELTIQSTTITVRSKKQIAIDRPEGMGYMVMRDKFDELIARKAAAKGAVFHEQEKVYAIESDKDHWIVRTDKNAYSSDFLVGADGAPSRVARQLGLMENFDRYGTAIAAELMVSDQQLKRQGPSAHFDFQLLKKGYAWIFPKSDHLSIGVFTTLSKANNLEAYLEAFIDSHPNLRGYKKMFFRRGGLIPRGGVYNCLVTEGALLVGDAAAMCDPFFGEGIYYGAKSGILAADAIIEAMKQGHRRLASYDELCRDTLTREFWWARFFNFTFYRFPRLAHPIISHRPYLQDLVLDVNSGKLSWRSCVLKMVFLSPYWAFKRERD